MIELTQDEYQQVRKLLATYVPGCEVRAFGSRVHRRNIKPWSDLDLVVMSAPEQACWRSDLQEACAESDLPFVVDIADWAQLSPAFRAVIAQEGSVVLQQHH